MPWHPRIPGCCGCSPRSCTRPAPTRLPGCCVRGGGWAWWSWYLPRRCFEMPPERYLKAMGWREHQALLIPHTDTAHPHLHIILNRVHPETGLVLNDWREQQRSQRWGDRYDKEQGLIL